MRSGCGSKCAVCSGVESALMRSLKNLSATGSVTQYGRCPGFRALVGPETTGTRHALRKLD
jgi:hypothetical protein